ncbi:MAG TPA: c-type cytochrome biogenesis protein CcmI [Pseudolabrys sp.]
MALWLAFALMTATAIFAVLWPLSRRGEARGGSELAVYRDQLDEIGRDRTAGLIGEAEAEAARIEVSRRLIAASEAPKSQAPLNPAASLWRRRATAVAGLLLLPIGATALYLLLGSPQLPGEPLAARLENAHPDGSIAAMISKVEAHLERHPDDARGYEVLAPVYMRLGRFGEAVTARHKLIALSGDSADREADLGEALTAAANGIVTDEAKSAFEQAAKLDPNEVKSQFFLGLAAEQDGNKDKAASIWKAMLANAPPGAPWVATVKEAITRVGGTPPAVAGAPGPNAAQMAAASQMSGQDRTVMIRGMVERLAGKLKQDGNDVEGWQRLLRAYLVLGDHDKAVAAAGDAKRALASNPDKLRQIEDMIKSLGLEG